MNDLVFSQNNKVYASSMKVAEIFQKQHKKFCVTSKKLLRIFLFRNICTVLSQSEDFPIQEHLHNFGGVKYQDAKGEYRPAYQMTRDDFAILVMKDNSMKVEFEVKSA